MTFKLVPKKDCPLCGGKGEVKRAYCKCITNQLPGDYDSGEDKIVIVKG